MLGQKQCTRKSALACHHRVRCSTITKCTSTGRITSWASAQGSSAKVGRPSPPRRSATPGHGAAAERVRHLASAESSTGTARPPGGDAPGAALLAAELVSAVPAELLERVRDISMLFRVERPITSSVN